MAMAQTTTPASQPSAGDQTPDMTPSAAIRVFAVPELLENILIHLRTDPVTYSGLAAPTFEIFTLQRVNSTFQATIKGSKRCRQLMLQQSSDGSCKTRIEMVRWLFHELGLSGVDTIDTCGGTSEDEAHFEFLDGNELQITGRGRDTLVYFAKIEEYRGLRWITESTLAEDDMEDLRLEVTLERDLLNSRDEAMQPSCTWDRHLEDCESYVEDIGPYTGGDLGTLLDSILVVLERTPCEHRAARDDWPLRHIDELCVSDEGEYRPYYQC